MKIRDIGSFQFPVAGMRFVSDLLEAVATAYARRFFGATASTESHSHNSHWNFVPTAWESVPHAKVYLKDPADQAGLAAVGLKPNRDLNRYRFIIRIVSAGDSEPPAKSSPIATLLFVVKGNPLIVSPTALPCFASGTEAVALDLRSSEVEALNLQVVVKDMGCHFALPVEELVDYAINDSPLERWITTWDTQTGAMGAECLVSIQCEREQPFSVKEIIEIRKRSERQVEQKPSDSSVKAPGMKPAEPDQALEPAQQEPGSPSSYWSALANQASEFLGASPSEKAKTHRRSMRGVPQNFELIP